MTPMRVSATAVEAFRLFMHPDNEWMTLEDLEAQILGRSPVSDAMRIGTAFGQIIEHGGDAYRQPSGIFSCLGVQFLGDGMQAALDTYDRRGLFEVKGTQAYGDVLVVAKADHLLGRHLTETKTTLNAFDFEKYAHSVQWRLMADIFDPTLVTYKVALLGEFAPQTYEVRDLVEFNLFPYARLHSDCADIVAQFRAFAVARGLDAPLRARQASLEAAA